VESRTAPGKMPEGAPNAKTVTGGGGGEGGGRRQGGQRGRGSEEREGRQEREGGAAGSASDQGGGGSAGVKGIEGLWVKKKAAPPAMLGKHDARALVRSAPVSNET